ncbi:MAG: ATP-binding cassette domain-containing protein, partial [Propionicimonas sp.]|nr:ATP-binding cassette domain-containing protein [Propionicimonas sp.]
LDGVSIDVPRRGHTAIVGPSGAGKTTIMSLLLRFLSPDTGRVGGWLHARAGALRILVGAVAAVVLLVNRPLTVGVVLWTVVGAAVVLGVLGLLQRPPAAEEAAPTEN